MVAIEHVFVLPIETAYYTAGDALAPLHLVCTNEHGCYAHTSFVSQYVVELFSHVCCRECKRYFKTNDHDSGHDAPSTRCNGAELRPPQNPTAMQLLIDCPARSTVPAVLWGRGAQGNQHDRIAERAPAPIHAIPIETRWRMSQTRKTNCVWIALWYREGVRWTRET